MGYEVLWYIAVLVVAAGLSYALTPKPPVPPPASLEDFTVPTAEEGRPIPVVFGEEIVTGSNVLWYGALANTPIHGGGGKK